MSIDGKLWYRDTFLQSDEWKTFRSQVLLDTGAKCYLCGCEDVSNDVHHVWYGEPSYTGQRQFVVLCRDCHKVIHEMYPPTSAATEAEKSALWGALKKFKMGWWIRSAKRAGKPWTNCSGCGCEKARCRLVNPITGKPADGFEPHSYLSLCPECIEAIQQAYGFLEHGTAQRWKEIKQFLRSRPYNSS